MLSCDVKIIRQSLGHISYSRFLGRLPGNIFSSKWSRPWDDLKVKHCPLLKLIVRTEVSKNVPSKGGRRNKFSFALVKATTKMHQMIVQTTKTKTAAITAKATTRRKNNNNDINNASDNNTNNNNNNKISNNNANNSDNNINNVSNNNSNWLNMVRMDVWIKFPPFCIVESSDTQRISLRSEIWSWLTLHY